MLFRFTNIAGSVSTIYVADKVYGNDVMGTNQRQMLLPE